MSGGMPRVGRMPHDGWWLGGRQLGQHRHAGANQRLAVHSRIQHIQHILVSVLALLDGKMRMRLADPAQRFTAKRAGSS